MRYSNQNVDYLFRTNLKQSLKFSLVWLVALIMTIASGVGKLGADLASGVPGSKRTVKMLQTPGVVAISGATPKADMHNIAIVSAGVTVVFMTILQVLWVMPLMTRNTCG